MLRTEDVNSRFFSSTLRWAVLVCLFIAPQLYAQQLLVVSSQTTQPYLQAVSQLKAAFDSDQITVLNRPASVVDDSHIHQAQLIITLGLKALERVLAQNESPPVLAAMIPKQSFEALVTRFDAATRIERRRLSALYLEQPYSRQIKLARLLMPESRRLGILLGPQSDRYRHTLEQQAFQQGVQTTLASLDQQGNPLTVIRRLVGQSDALLALPDDPEFTRNTAKWLLMLSLRQRIPLIGFSQRYVDAGALASVFSSPATISDEIALWGAQWFEDSSQGLPPPSYPNLFELSLNPSIAARLGISLPGQEQLRSELQLDSFP